MTKVQLLSMGNFNQWQTAKAEEARRLIEETVNSNAFQQAVLKAKFLDTRLERADGTITEKLSNEQILAAILNGVEQGQAADRVIGLRVILYYRPWGVGWTDEDGGIHTNTGFFNREDPISVAGHWMHEWLHAAGFIHDHSRTSRRDHSVPYLVGELLVEHGAPFVKLLAA